MCWGKQSVLFGNLYNIILKTKFVVECPYGDSQCQVTLIYRQPITKISRSKICRQSLALFRSKVDVNSLPVSVNLAVKPFPVRFTAWTLSHTNRLSQYVGCRRTERSLQSWRVVFPVQDGQASGALYHFWCSWAEIFVIPIVIIFIACHCSAKYWELFQGCKPSSSAETDLTARAVLCWS